MEFLKLSPISEASEREEVNDEMIILKGDDSIDRARSYLERALPRSKRPPKNKKPVQPNGFFIFMKERRSCLEAEGMSFSGGWREVSELLDAEWKGLCYDERERYIGIARNNPTAVPKEFRRPSFGRRFGDIKAAEMESHRQEAQIIQTLSNLLERIHPIVVNVILIHFTSYSAEGGKAFIPAEVAMSCFNMKHGLKDNFWSLIDPYFVPMGYGSKVSRRAEKLGLPLPGYSNYFQNYKRIVDNIEAFVQKHENPGGPQLVFCQRQEMNIVKGCLEWMYDQYDQRKCSFQVMPVGELVRRLSYLGVVHRSIKTGLPMALIMAKFVGKNLTSPTMIDYIAKCSVREARGNGKLSSAVSTSGYDTAQYESDNSAETDSIISYEEELNLMKHAWECINLVKEKVFLFEHEVDQFLDRRELANDERITCIYHMNCEIEGLDLCPLNVVNRHSYYLMGALVRHFSITPLIGFHVVDHLFANMELKRTKSMLEKWDKDAKDQLEFKWDGKPPSNFSYRVVGEIKPVSYRVA